MDYRIYIHNSGDNLIYSIEGYSPKGSHIATTNIQNNSYSETICSIVLNCFNLLGKDCKLEIVSPLLNFMLGKKSKLIKNLEAKSINLIQLVFTPCLPSHPVIKHLKKETRKQSVGKYIAIDPENVIPDYIAYTDGSCNNLSPFREGGAAFVIVDGNNKDSIITSQSKCILDTTNNRAELLAILSAVRYVPEHSTLFIRTDSRYCIDVLTNKKNANCPHMTNGDIITQFFREESRLKQVYFEWVKGHNGDYYNEMADSLAESRREEVRELYRIPVYTYRNRNEPNPRIERFYNWFETSEDAAKYKDTLTF